MAALMIATGEGWTLYRGDCPAALKELADNSIDAVVTDPPYELAFMSRHWDATGIAYSVDLWREVLRVLRPGGHLLAFGGTRTYHRMVCAIEDAGFEVRDCIQWLYGSGFPKSKSMRDIDRPELGTALKPSHEPIVLARKPLAAPTVAANVLEHGTGALNIAQTRVGEHDYTQEQWTQKGASRTTGSTYGTHRASDTPLPAGRWPPNLCLTHSAGCVKVGRKRVRPTGGRNPTERNGKMWLGSMSNTDTNTGYADADGMEEVDDWQCEEGCPVKALDSQAGERKSGGGVKSKAGRQLKNYGIYGECTPTQDKTGPQGLEPDTGSASRFFPVFAYEQDDFVPWLYCAKASRREREAGDGEGAHHSLAFCSR